MIHFFAQYVHTFLMLKYNNCEEQKSMKKAIPIYYKDISALNAKTPKQNIYKQVLYKQPVTSIIVIL